MAQKYSVQPIPQFRRTTLNSPTLKGNYSIFINNIITYYLLIENINVPVTISSPTSTETITTTITVPTTNVISPDKSPPEGSALNDASRTEKLKKIREILAQRPGFGTKSKNHCPIVRKISDPDKKVCTSTQITIKKIIRILF